VLPETDLGLSTTSEHCIGRIGSENRSVLRKIKGAIGENAVRYIEKLNAGLHATAVGASDYSERGEMIDNLMVAIEDHKVTLIVYQSMQSTEAVELEVYPLGMVFHKGSLYLIAWSSRRAEVRNFKLDRIEDVDVTKVQCVVAPRRVRV